jgi:hypothetical protein
MIQFISLFDRICAVKIIEKHDRNPSFRNKLKNFWKDVHSAWITLMHQNLDPRKEPIFYNQNIKGDNKTICYPQWLIRGVSTLNYIIDKSGKCYTWEIFKQKYKSVINATPNTWKNNMSQKGETRGVQSSRGKLGSFPARAVPISPFPILPISHITLKMNSPLESPHEPKHNY